MADMIDFDALSRKTGQPDRTMQDMDHLYAAVFALAQWHFIARGQLPNLSPYIASNSQIADGQYMVRAFTDTERLWRFARENNLMETDADGKETVSILSLPTATLVDYLEQFISQGVHGVWFNSDQNSDGFFVPLKQLRPIRDHLTSMGLLPRG